MVDDANRILFFGRKEFMRIRKIQTRRKIVMERSFMDNFSEIKQYAICINTKYIIDKVQKLERDLEKK